MSNASQSRASNWASAARSVFTTNVLLRKQLWIWPLIAGFVLIGIGWWVRSSVERAAKQSMKNNLQTILDADVEALRIWLKGEEANALAAANEPHMQVAATQLVETAASADDAAAQLLQTEPLRKLRTELEPWLKTHGYDGFVLVDARRVIVAARLDYLVGNAELAQDAEFLDKVFRGETTVSTPFKSVVLLEDFSGEMRAGVPTMFSAAPVYDASDEVIAAMCLRIPPDDTFTKILSIAQAGDTGETYAFDKDGLLLSQSRFDEDLKQIGLITDDDMSRSILSVQIRDPQVDMVRGERPKLRRKEQPLTRMAASAVEGNSGIDVEGYRDYRGRPVVGAWTWLPDYEFGVATEVDVREAYEPIYILRYAFWALFGLLAAAAVAIFVFSVVVARLDRTARRAALEAKQLGQYSLDEKIGAGGMGVVYRGHHAMLQRPTAVKLLDVEKTNDETIARFEREVQLTAGLKHPNTIAIYDYGRTPEGVFYYAMELLDGLNLEELVKRFGPQPEGRVIDILRQLCGSLAEAHGVGLVHRDIKPANVILTQLGGVPDFAKLLDFGLVKAVDSQRLSGLTTSGSLTGTPLYMSPEAIEAPNRVDARSDLYAVGAIGYFLLTGRPVFEGQNVIEICAQHVESAPETPSSRLGRPISPDLETVILHCLAKKQEDRPESAEALEAELAVCQAAGSWTRAEARSWWQRFQDGSGEPMDRSSPTNNGTFAETIVRNTPPSASG